MLSKVLVAGMCFSLIAGCVTKDDDESLKNSSTVATSDIKAFYGVEVLADNKVNFYANFTQADQSLDLASGDAVAVEINSEKVSLIEFKNSSVITYSLVKRLDPVASSYVFDLSRRDYENASTSVVKVPVGFEPTEPSDKATVNALNNTFMVRWQNDQTSSNSAGTSISNLTLRYDFDCRNGNSSYPASAVGSDSDTNITDNGQHEVDLNKVLNIPVQGFNLGRCDHFNITMIRTDSSGVLDGALKDGSAVVGSQVRFIKKLSITNIQDK